MKKFILIIAALFCGLSFAQDYYLENGIPVYYKNVDSTRMCSVMICIRGGTSVVPREYSGLEASLLELMTRGSQKYSYDDLQRLEIDSHIGINSSNFYNGSTFSFSCIDYYFNTAFDAFIDCFLNPSYDEEQFTRLLTEIDQNIQRTQNDPLNSLFYQIGKTVYKDHPLGASSSVNPDSRQNITIENLMSHYKKIIDAKRIFVVASGRIKEKVLVKKLNATLGKIPSLDTEFRQVEYPPVKVGGKKVTLKNPLLEKGSGHVIRVFTGPSVHDEDYIAARIASDMFSSDLFHIVREKYGACYSAYSEISSTPAGIGFDILYSASDIPNATKYVNEAISVFASGVLGEDAVGVCLPGFINKYITSSYENQRTCASIASRAAASLFVFNDINALDKRLDAVKKLTADDIMRVFKKYWQTDNYQWFEVVSE